MRPPVTVTTCIQCTVWALFSVINLLMHETVPPIVLLPGSPEAEISDCLLK